MKNYSVVFGNREKSISVTIAKDLIIEEAVQFALNLHRSSNCVHVISVFFSSEKGTENVVNFYSEK